MRAEAGVRSATVIVGREAEVEALTRMVDQARSGRSTPALVVGEGGVGKTRLLDEAVSAARQAGVAVAAARPAIAAAVPFGLIAEALRSWLRGHPVDLGRSPFDHGLRLILPEWDVGADQLTDLAAGQLRLLALEATVRLLTAISSSSGGVLLALDDLHAADPESLEVLRYVASAAPDGLAIVATLRPGESLIADELVRALRAGAAAQVFELEPLRPRAVSDLISALLDAAPPPELVADVMARTD